MQLFSINYYYISRRERGGTEGGGDEGEEEEERAQERAVDQKRLLPIQALLTSLAFHFTRYFY